MAGEKDRSWKKAFFATSKDRTQYTAWGSDETKELFYEHPTKPFLYNKGGSLIGYRGSDQQAHFSNPKKGWGLGENEMSKYSNVGPIVNKYLGTGSGRMSEYGKYSDVLSPLSKMNPNQDIRRSDMSSNIVDWLKQY